MKCISCNKESLDAIMLPCSKCGEKISRCKKCRSLSIEYSCNKCERKGP